jgi:hypothetical protein
MADRAALRDQLLQAVGKAEPAVIAKVVTRLLAQLDDAAAERVVAALLTEGSEADEEDESAAAEAVREGNEMARRQIGNRGKSRDAFR